METNDINWIPLRKNLRGIKTVNISQTTISVKKDSIPEVAESLHTTNKKFLLGTRNHKLIIKFGDVGYKFKVYSTYICINGKNTNIKNWLSKNNLTFGTYELSYIGENMYEGEYSESLSIKCKKW